MIPRTHLVSHTLGYDIRSGYLGHEHRITKNEPKAERKDTISET